MEIKNQYNQIGKNYISGQKDFFSKREGAAHNFLRSCLPDLNGKIVLDLGCGNGPDIQKIEELNPKEVWGIDISEVMVNEAKKIVKNPERIVLGDFSNNSFQDHFFDIIIGRFSLHYFNNFDKAYIELSRILKKGGQLILVVHHPLRDLHSQKNKRYGHQEIIKIELYNNKVPIYFPTHTFGEYFSKTFFDNFIIVNFKEEESPEEYVDIYGTPGWFGFKAIKK
jgi:ubiquinone/menaquinone biosynthesis C-methylase UbiE